MRVFGTTCVVCAPTIQVENVHHCHRTSPLQPGPVALARDCSSYLEMIACIHFITQHPAIPGCHLSQGKPSALEHEAGITQVFE